LGRRIRIVVGEGRTAQQGLLRFVLEGEGFDIVGEASSVADLAVAIAEGQPDVVVLDDGIGVVAVSMVREVLPQTKIVLVWPSAVVPIGGDARVEPAKILNDLGPAVRHVSPVGVGAGLTETFDRPEWIERVRKDPATLRDKLDTTGKETAKRPSVTELQRRGARLHPSSRKAKRTAPKEPSEIVALPEAEGAAVGAEGASSEPAEGVEAASSEPIEERSEWNRRLGMLALSGAAAVSALVLALAIGGGRVDTSIVRGGGYVPPGTVFSSGGTEAGPFIDGSLGGDGYTPIPTPTPGPTESGGPGGETEAPPPGGDVSAPSGGTDQTGPDTSPDGGAPRAGEEGDGGGGNGGGGNGGGAGNGAHDLAMPGRSTGNPFGGPPSKLGLTPAHGAGMGSMVNDAAEHGARIASGHAHKH
jgi:hypothetical protein